VWTRAFIADETGAITVDWVVLTGGLVGIGIATVAVVSGGVENLSRDTDAQLSVNATLMGRFDMREIANASFEDIAGMLAAGWGFYTRDPNGWTSFNANQIEVVRSGYHGVTASDGDWMLDMEGSPGNILIGQEISGAVQGQTYTLTFDAADPRNSNNIEVFWGGQLIETVNPSGNAMQTFTVEVEGGAGDGSNLLMIGGAGPRDNVGAYIDNIALSN
jgi:hypothetical protein